MPDNPQEPLMPDPEEKFPSPMPMYEATIEKTLASVREDYGGGLVGTVEPHQMTVTEMLQGQKKHLEYQLQKVNEALAQAAKNQGAMDLLDSLAKTGIRR